MLALKSEGFGGDFRSGYEDAFRLIMDLMEPPREMTLTSGMESLPPWS